MELPGKHEKMVFTSVLPNIPTGFVHGEYPEVFNHLRFSHYIQSKKVL